MKSRKILIFGNYGGQNWGDECILQGLLSLLDKRHYKITVVSSNPAHTKKHHAVAAVHPFPFGLRSCLMFWRWAETILVLRAADIVIFGGGGLLQDLEPKAIWLWWWQMRIVKFFGKRMIAVGQSIGPLKHSRSQKMAISTLTRAKYISVRDQVSQRLFIKLGGSSTVPGVELATDFLFATRKAPAVQKRKGSVVCLHANIKISKQKLLNICNALPKPVRFLAMDTIDSVLLTKRDIAGLLKQDTKYQVVQPKNITELKKIFALAEFVVSARLHGVLLSIQQQTPFLALGHSLKIENFLKTVGLRELFQKPSQKEQLLLQNIRDIKKQKWQEKLRNVYNLEREKVQLLLPVFLQK